MVKILPILSSDLKVNILVRNSGLGLNRDAAIVAEVLQDAGFQVRVNSLHNKLFQKPYFQTFIKLLSNKSLKLQHEVYQAFSQTILGKPIYDINLFLEFVVPQWFPYARVNCLIPNQEWFLDSWLPHLKNVDKILCKTKYAEEIFQNLGCQTEFISFTSLDRLNKTSAKPYDTFLHLAGKSLQKGTQKIIDLWLRHPEWPLLKIINNRPKSPVVAADNIEYITKYIDDRLLREYQNYHNIHLCPSEAEGFGHYIGEAASCQAVIVTTNAPPMNELILPERGILVDYHDRQVQRLGDNYYVDAGDLERKIEEVLAMDLRSKKQLGENARAWYEDNDRFFKRQIVEVLRNI